MRRLAAIALLLLAPAVSADEPPAFLPGQICCLLEQDCSIEDLNARWGTITLQADPETDLYLLYIDRPSGLEAFIDSLSLDADVDIVEPNYLVETPEAVRQMVYGAVGGDWEDFQDQELTGRIGLAAAHAIAQGEGVTVGVLDTGVDPGHEAFAGRLVAGFDCVDYDQFPWECANGLDDDGDGTIDEGHGHGTMVAGLVALVAPEATILPVRVLDDEGRGTAYGITKGLIWASSHGARVVNMSFGLPEVIIALKRKIRVAAMHDCAVVAGAGNRGEEEPPYHPACDSLAFMVTAVDSQDVKADFADYGSLVFLSAPGVGVRSAYPGGEWAIGSGCSFATPLVAAEAALLLSHFGHLDRVELAERMAGGVVPIYGIPGNEPYLGKLGAGRIHLARALGDVAAAETPRWCGEAPALHAWPSPTRGTIELRSVAAGDDDWLRVAILDAGGRVVRSLAGPGASSLLWDGRDQGGHPLAPGRYWARDVSSPAGAAAPILIVR